MSALKPVSFRKARALETSAPELRGGRCHQPWTEDELDIVRRHYPTGGVQACLAHLPHRTVNAVRNTATRKLGIIRTQYRTRRTPDIPADIDDHISAAWPLLGTTDSEGRVTIVRLADRLGISDSFLRRRATHLGLVSPRRRQPSWTRAEDRLLRTVPLHHLERCAEIFRENGYNRSPGAIATRAERLKISKLARRKTMTASDVARILGVGRTTVTTWCITGYLKAGQLNTGHRRQRSFWAIEPADLRAFIINNLERIDFRKVDRFAIVDLLTRTDEGKVAGTVADFEDGAAGMLALPG